MDELSVRYQKGLEYSKADMIEVIPPDDEDTIIGDYMLYLSVSSKFLPTIDGPPNKIIDSGLIFADIHFPGKFTIEEISANLHFDIENIQELLKNSPNPIKVEEKTSNEFDDMVIINEKTGSRTFNHEAIAIYIHNKLRTVAWGHKNVASWNSNKYNSHYGESKIKSELHRVASEIGYIKNITDLETGVMKRLYQINNKSNDYPFGKSYYKLYMNNGVIFIDPEDNYKIKLLPHNPSELNDYVLTSQYNPNANIDKTMNWLEQFGDIKDDYINIIATIFAHKMLYDIEIFKIIFYILGDKNTGKTWLFEKILKSDILGCDNTSSLKIHDMSDKFLPSEMVGKVANIGDDTAGTIIKEISVIKKYSGGSGITVQRKFESPFTNNVWGQLLFTGNKMPLFDNAELETDSALYDRFIIVNLKQKLCSDNTPEDKIPDGFKKVIPCDDEIVEGIVKLAIDRAAIYLKEGTVSGFKNSLKDELIKYNDNFYRFYDECIMEANGYYVIYSELKEEYEIFAKNYNISQRDKIRMIKLKEKMMTIKGIKCEYVKIGYSNLTIFYNVLIKNSEHQHKLPDYLIQGGIKQQYVVN